MLCIYSHRSNVSSCAKGTLSPPAQKTFSLHKEIFPLAALFSAFPLSEYKPPGISQACAKPHLAFPILLPPIPGFNQFVKCVEQHFPLSSPVTTLTSLRVLWLLVTYTEHFMCSNPHKIKEEGGNSRFFPRYGTQQSHILCYPNAFTYMDKSWLMVCDPPNPKPPKCSFGPARPQHPSPKLRSKSCQGRV